VDNGNVARPKDIENRSGVLLHFARTLRAYPKTSLGHTIHGRKPTRRFFKMTDVRATHVRIVIDNGCTAVTMFGYLLRQGDFLLVELLREAFRNAIQRPSQATILGRPSRDTGSYPNPWANTD